MSPRCGSFRTGEQGVTQALRPCREIPVEQMIGGVLARLRPDPAHWRRPGPAGRQPVG